MLQASCVHAVPVTLVCDGCNAKIRIMGTGIAPLKGFVDAEPSFERLPEMEHRRAPRDARSALEIWNSEDGLGGESKRMG
jgi:hypothetical protein